MEVPEFRTRQDVSKALFARGSQLDVWSKLLEYTIDPPEPFYLKRVVQETGLPASNVGVEFRVLREVGWIMPVEVPHEPSDREKYYTRINPEMWSVIGRLINEIDQRIDTSTWPNTD